MLDYNPETGLAVWKTTNMAGRVAGCIDGAGYRVITILGKRLKFHRVIWLYAYGRMPRYEVDHIDGDRSNNRLVNLRDVTRRRNNIDRKIKRLSKEGHRGVFKTKAGTYRATFSLHLGVYKTAEEAGLAYAKFYKELAPMLWARAPAHLKA